MRMSFGCDLDLDVVVDDRVDPDRGEGGVAAGGRVEGRDADQAVDPALGLQPAVGVRAADPVGDRADAGLLARALGDQLDLHAVRLGPADVHAGEHRRPVAALGAAGAGVDLEEGVVAVGLAVEQRLGLPGGGLVADRADRGLGVGDDGLVALGLAELDQLLLVGEVLGAAACSRRGRRRASGGRASASGRGPGRSRGPGSRSSRSALRAGARRSPSRGAGAAARATSRSRRPGVRSRRASGNPA